MGNSVHTAPDEKSTLSGLSAGNGAGLPLEKSDDHHAPPGRAAAVEGAGLDGGQEGWVAAASWP